MQFARSRHPASPRRTESSGPRQFLHAHALIVAVLGVPSSSVAVYGVYP